MGRPLAYVRSWWLPREITGLPPTKNIASFKHVSETSQFLLDSIRVGEVPSPDLMDWNTWQKWRRLLVKRHTRQDGEATTTTAQESTLWRAVMNQVHTGDSAATLILAAAATEEDAEAEAAQSGATLSTDAPSTSAPPLTATAPPTDVSPGSRHPNAVNPGSGARSPVSWTSKSPGTPTGFKCH